MNKYLSLNELGIIKSRTETMPEVGFKQNVLRYTNSPLITVKRNVYAVKLNDEVVYRNAWREQSGIELFSNRIISSGWVNLRTYIRMTGVTSYNNISLCQCHGYCYS